MSEELLVELVKRYSPSLQEAEAVAYLVGWMGANGFGARIDDVGNAVGIRGDANAPRTLMLLGHIDTYPGTVPVQIKDGCLYGRGSVDAKGSLCTFVAAAAAATIPDGWRVVVVGALEEENVTSKGAVHIRETMTPDMCIIGEPSGVGRITLGYKGRLLVDYSVSRAMTHTARPEPSIAMRGVAFWNAVAAWATAANEGVDKYFDQVMANLRSINTSNDHYSETVTMTLGFRLPPRITPDETLAKVKELADANADIRAYGAEHAYQSDKNNALVRGMLTAIRAEGMQPGFVLKTGTCDMNIVGVKWTCPIIAYGPGDSNLDHTPDEHLPLAEYAQAIGVVRRFIEALPRSDEG